jgi:hypothetical protein
VAFKGSGHKISINATFMTTLKKGNSKKAILDKTSNEEILEYNGIVYIAYLRRSTTKVEQEMSIEKQNDSVILMARNISVPIEYINIYSDSFTGYKIKTIN